MYTYKYIVYICISILYTSVQVYCMYKYIVCLLMHCDQISFLLQLQYLLLPLTPRLFLYGNEVFLLFYNFWAVSGFFTSYQKPKNRIMRQVVCFVVKLSLIDVDGFWNLFSRNRHLTPFTTLRDTSIVTDYCCIDMHRVILPSLHHL